MSTIKSNTLVRDRWIIHVAVVGSYFAKAVTKGVGGVLLGSPPLINDALHGALDIGEHGLIAWVGRHARKEKESRYPLGRKPLLDIVGLVIGLGIGGLAFKCIQDACAALWVVLESVFDLTSKVPAFLTNFLPEVDTETLDARIWLVGIIFILCSIVSFFVYHLETFLARKHRLREYIDDAMELRQDATLELTTGTCILLAWGLILTLHWRFGISSEYVLINAGAQAIVLLFLSGYLSFHAFHAIRENVHNLLHPGIDDETTRLLKHHVERSLPDGCCLSPSEGEKLLAYTSGEVLHVSGVLRIPRPQMASADMIVALAEHLARQFLRQHTEEANIRFFPISYHWCLEDAEAEWNRLLKEVWSVEQDEIMWSHFAAFKKGEFTELSPIGMCATTTTDNVAVLTLWLQASTEIFLHGANSLATETSSELIRHLLSEMSESDPRRIPFLCWMVLKGIMSGRIYSDSIQESTPELRELTEAIILLRPSIPIILLAEFHFMLGLHWERQPAFELKQSDYHYRKALSLYLEAGYPLEADRLMNAWGHQKGLLYEIEESLYLLDQSRQIKEIKGDRTGLAVTYGCLGDTLRRAGSCDLAVEAYHSDLAICVQMGLTDAITSITCKLAEALICWGVLFRDSEKIEEAIHVLEELRQKPIIGQQDAFFVCNALAKGLIWKTFLSTNDQRVSVLNAAMTILSETTPFSPYTTALWRRLKGRAAYLNGDMEAALSFQEEARAGFYNMSAGVSARMNSLQSICCVLESAIYQSYNVPTYIYDACNAVQHFSDNLGGLLGPAKERFEEYVCVLRDVKANRDAFTHASHALLALIEG